MNRLTKKIKTEPLSIISHCVDDDNNDDGRVTRQASGEQESLCQRDTNPLPVSRHLNYFPIITPFVGAPRYYGAMRGAINVYKMVFTHRRAVTVWSGLCVCHYRSHRRNHILVVGVSNPEKLNIFSIHLRARVTRDIRHKSV